MNSESIICKNGPIFIFDKIDYVFWLKMTIA